MRQWILLLLICLQNAAPIAAEVPHVRGELISSVSSVSAGDNFEVIFRQDIDDGWHTYWTNPGDSGAAPDITWDIPDTVQVSDFQYPYPERIAYGPLMNFGYHDEVLLPFRVSLDDAFTGDILELNGRGRVLVCADICIPQSIELSLSVPIADTTVSAGNETLFQLANSLIPVAIDVPANYSATDDRIEFSVGLPGVQGNRIQSIDFFPNTPDVIDNAADQTWQMTEAGLVVSLVPGFDFRAGESDLSGVIVIREGEDLVSSYAITQGEAAVDPVPTGPTETSMGLLLAMGFAFIGGLILNLMPCVFPVLSIKVLSLAESAAGAPTAMRMHGWAYTAGVVGSFVVIALILMGLRAGGEAIGWGFQLQSPVVVALLAYLFVLIGLNLLGMFEIGTSFMQLGGAGGSSNGYLSSVSTGVLATIVAAPCTAPFMGAAVGYALLQSGTTGVLVFAALGLGMAVPYLLLTYSPALLKRMPRPGPWMETLRQALAFPMLASAIWLLWVLGVQAGATAMMQVLAGALLIAFAIWLIQKTRSTRGRHVSMVVAIGFVGVALYAAGTQQSAVAITPDAETAAAPADATPYSKQALTQALESGPVFVNFTAAWCITCKVNELNALEVQSVKTAFATHGVSYLKADWTNEDPLITEALKAYGRSGVPLYLLYERGSDRATVLPQILTPGIVIDALEQLSPADQ